LLVCVYVAAFVMTAADVGRNAGWRSPAPFSIQSADDIVLEGTMEVLIEDGDRSSRTLYFLISDHRRVPLRFRRPPLNLVTGTRVRVRGRWADGDLVVSELEKL